MEKKLKIENLRNHLNEAEAILIGAGAGLSISAGLTYAGERFEKFFADFEEKYNFRDMYSGGFFPFATPEEKWAYWSRYVFINRYSEIPKPVYKNLLKLVKNKNYFVLTTNVDHCFQRTGFDKKRLFYTQGDFGLFQCSLPCHNKTYDNKEIIIKMMEQQKNMSVPTELIPHCPVCGSLMTMNLRADDTFVEDDGWHLACDNYVNFLNESRDKKTVFLDIGTGMNTPGIIKFPFWQMTREWPDAFYVCINLGEAYVPSREKFEDKSLCIDSDIGEVIEELI